MIRVQPLDLLATGRLIFAPGSGSLFLPHLGTSAAKRALPCQLQCANEVAVELSTGRIVFRISLYIEATLNVYP